MVNVSFLTLTEGDAIALAEALHRERLLMFDTIEEHVDLWPPTPHAHAPERSHQGTALQPCGTTGHRSARRSFGAHVGTTGHQLRSAQHESVDGRPLARVNAEQLGPLRVP